MNKKAIIFLLANIPLSLVLFYLLAILCGMILYPFTMIVNIGLLLSIFSIIIIGINLLILKRLKSLDFLTVFVCVFEVLIIGFIIYQREISLKFWPSLIFSLTTDGLPAWFACPQSSNSQSCNISTTRLLPLRNSTA